MGKVTKALAALALGAVTAYLFTRRKDSSCRWEKVLIFWRTEAAHAESLFRCTITSLPPGLKTSRVYRFSGVHQEGGAV